MPRAINGGLQRYATVTGGLSSAQVNDLERGKDGDLQAGGQGSSPPLLHQQTPLGRTSYGPLTTKG